MKERQDSWTDHDDAMLASTILRHIRSGSTQLKAFEEVADALGRTSAACGFRWNSTVRKSHQDAIIEAKGQRMASRKTKTSNQLSLPKVIARESCKNHPLLTAVKIITDYIESDEGSIEVQSEGKKHEDLINLLRSQEQEIEKLKHELELAKAAEIAVTEDYKSLLRILERARAMGLLNTDTEENTRSRFRMDLNGNLERIV